MTMMVVMVMLMMMMVMVKLLEQKSAKEGGGSSEVTGPVQQGGIRGGIFRSFFAAFSASTLFAFLAFSFLAGANEWIWNEY